ncbi:MAG: oxidoreductase [Betaproteobacteria bacterium]|nr:oxidoreductase [Betaproteobacteria bacterium]
MDTAPLGTIAVALFGYGYAGSILHAPLISSVPGLRLAAVCSGNDSKVHADWPEVFVSAAVEEVLNYPGISLVVIATPNHSHFDLARRAMLAGKHVVVDKPFTVTSGEAHELHALAHRLNLHLSVFHNRRWDADFLTLRNLLLDGRLGQVSYLESRFERFRPLVRDRWREHAGPGNGLWYDLGPHLLDQALQLFGSPSSLKGTLETQRQGAQAIDYFRVLLKYPTGLQVVLLASMLGVDDGLRLLVLGSKGRYIKHGLDPQEAALKRGEDPSHPSWGKDGCDGMLTLTGHDGMAQETLPTQPGDYSCYYRGIRDALLHGAPNPVPASDAVEVMRLIELVCLSQASGQLVTC